MGLIRRLIDFVLTSAVGDKCSLSQRWEALAGNQCREMQKLNNLASVDDQQERWSGSGAVDQGKMVGGGRKVRGAWRRLACWPGRSFDVDHRRARGFWG